MGFRRPHLLLLLMALTPGEGTGVRNKRSFATCEIARDSCTAHFPDMESFQNIVEGFRGYNVIQGNLILDREDRYGPQGLVFDEAAERSGPVRFNNIAGHEVNSCSREFQSTFSNNMAEYLDSMVETDSSSSSFQLGSEVKITGELGKEGVGSISAERTIPPLYQSLSSNSHSMQDIATKMDAGEIAVTRTWTQCNVYRYQLQPNTPPSFHSGFQAALATLGRCWNGPNETACAKTFIDQFGTHFVQRATFGARKTTTRQFESKKAQTASDTTVKDCSNKKSETSLLGQVSWGSSSSRCRGGTNAERALEAAGFLTERTVTLGKGLESWGLDLVPRMIYKELAPLSDLFQAEFMSGQTIDFIAIRPWLQDKILSYCDLFKSQHHCNFVVRHSFCPPARCALPCTAGLYTGPLDRDFRPHGHGTLTITAPRELRVTSTWTEGCTRFGVGQPHCPPARCALPCGLYTGQIDRHHRPHGRGTLTITRTINIAITRTWTEGCHDLTVVHREEVGNPPDYFQKTFAEYEQGFQSNGESWMGLVGLHEMTDSTDFGLRIEMGDYDGQKYHAVYDSFKVGPGPGYTLTVGGFRSDLSTLGNSMYSSNGFKFSTKDRDQDNWSRASCSTDRGSGGWWYSFGFGSFGNCGNTNPTGLHSTSRVHGPEYITYLTGGARGYNMDSWATATFTLVPRG